MYRLAHVPTFLVALLLAVTGCSDQLTGPNSSTSGPQATVHSGQGGPGGPASTTSLTCDVTVSPGDVIQTAIANAAAGDAICVEPGTYGEDLSVNKAVTLQGKTDPNGSSPATLDGSISVESDGVTITRLKVAPSTKVSLAGLDPFGIRITGNDAVIKENRIVGLTGEASSGSGTVHGIQIWHPGPSTISDIELSQNTILDIRNEVVGGAAGIKVQGVVEDVQVTGNRVRGVHSAGWVYGVTLTHTGNDPQARSPENVTVTGNTLAELNDGSEYDVFADPASAPYPGAAFAIDDTENPTGPGGADADEATVSQNNFLSAPIGTQNKDEVHTLIAECNYWGHASGPSNTMNNADKGALADGDVDFIPWSVRKIGQGRHPGNSCVGGRGGPGNGPSGGPGNGPGQ